MKGLEEFKTNQTPLNQIFGGEKVTNTCSDTKSGDLKIHKEDGFYDKDEDGVQGCDEVGFVNQTYVRDC